MLVLQISPRAHICSLLGLSARFWKHLLAQSPGNLSTSRIKVLYWMNLVPSSGLPVWLLSIVANSQNYLMDCQLYHFHYINENKNWTEAQQYCREKHTDLSTVTNMKDMKRLISISLRGINEAWIGLRDQTNAERSWHWSLPEVEFNESETNWEKDEPNNLQPGGQNCVIIWKDGSNFLKWGDLSCNEYHPFICYSVPPSETGIYSLIIR
uniref:C-type lectin domain-containing protein n=1 Tax=Poecilia reticulata TaxID=8081 RepID=A0A3P9NM67_POERE